MADTIRQRLKLAGGQLAEMSAEELAAQAGRSNAPTQPLETSVIGGNEDQAKMAGTPAQRVSALRQAIQGGQEQEDLSTRLRRQQVRRTATGAEREELARGERLQQLGSLDSRVEQLAEQALQRGAEQQQQVELQAMGEDAETNALLERIKQNPQDQQAILELNRKMGRTDAASMLTPQELLQQLGGQPAEIAEALSASIQDSISSGDLNFQDLGFQDINEVADLLGTDAQTLQGMSIQQMVDQVNAQIADEYSKVSSLEQRANDMALGAAERAEARAQLRELGAVGIRAVESDIDTLADEIQQANTVEFMGEEMPVEDLLDNDYVSGLVLKYFEQPDFAEKLAKEEPQLAEFIKKHEQLLQEEVKNIDQGVADFAELQNNNLSLQKTDVGDIPEDVMKEWYPDFGDITTESYKPNSVLKIFEDRGVSNSQKQDLMSAIDTMKEKGGREFVAELGNLSVDEIRRLGLMDSNSEQYKQLTGYMDKARSVASVDPKDSESVARLLGAGSAADLQATMREADTKARSGLFGGSDNLSSIREVLRPGQSIGSAALRLKSHYLNQDGSMRGLRDLLNNPIHDYSSDFNGVKSFVSGTNRVYEATKDAFKNDNIITGSEVDQILKKNTLEDLNEVYKNATIKDRIRDPEFEKKLGEAAKEKLSPRADEIVRIATRGQWSDRNFALGEAKKPVHWQNASFTDVVQNRMSDYIEALKKERDTYDPNKGGRDNPITAKALDSMIKEAESTLNNFNHERDAYVKEEERKAAEAARIAAEKAAAEEAGVKVPAGKSFEEALAEQKRQMDELGGGIAKIASGGEWPSYEFAMGEMDKPAHWEHGQFYSVVTNRVNDMVDKLKQESKKLEAQGKLSDAMAVRKLAMNARHKLDIFRGNWAKHQAKVNPPKRLSPAEQVAKPFVDLVKGVGGGVSQVGKTIGGGIAYEGKKLGGDIAREAKNLGGGIAKTFKKWF